MLKSFKNTAVNDIALYSQSQTWCTGSAPAPKINYPLFQKAIGLPAVSSVPWGPATFLTQGLPLLGLDQKPAAYLAVFQPVKQIETVEGTPRKNISRTAILFLLLATVLVMVGIKHYLASFKRLLQSIDDISRGNLGVSIPGDPWTEWGQLGRALQEMLERLKEKERISLILGKVVDPQAARKILAEKDYFSLKGEKRECTLLRADLKGFNTLSENMAPEALVESLNQYFSVIKSMWFSKHEGMLDKFIGGTVIAVWGAPFTHEDKESRAVKAALEIQETLRNFNISRIKKEADPPFMVGIGIHTGTVVSGQPGFQPSITITASSEKLFWWRPAFVPWRHQGQIVVSEETYGKIKNDVKGAPLNPIAVKGDLEPLKTYAVSQARLMARSKDKSPNPLSFQKLLLQWYDRNKRDLPWRGIHNPYATFVSEMMLQQTQVKTVIPYYHRFLKELPDWKSLAKAKEEKVQKLWEGLGYYRRARNLRSAAQKVMLEYRGKLPDTLEEISKLPGVGPYSAGAVLSIAFQKPHPVVDGNVIRVFSRLFLLRGNLKTGGGHQKVWELAQTLISKDRPGDFNQAVMELGATLCFTDNPQCLLCPLLSQCQASQKGLQNELPEMPKAQETVEIRMAALLIRKKGRVLVKKRSQEEKWLKGMWEFPSAE